MQELNCFSNIIKELLDDEFAVKNKDIKFRLLNSVFRGFGGEMVVSLEVRKMTIEEKSGKRYDYVYSKYLGYIDVNEKYKEYEKMFENGKTEEDILEYIVSQISEEVDEMLKDG